MRKWVSSPEYLLAVQLLADARRASGKTQREIEEQLGMNFHGWLAKIERGERQANVIDMIAILRAVGADEAQFFRDLAAQLPRKLVV